jgi:hypothetical protein
MPGALVSSRSSFRLTAPEVFELAELGLLA